MYYNENTIVYLNGEFVKAMDVRGDLFGQTVQYGYGVFEGIRSYKTAKGETRIFKADEHFRRLENSARLLHMPYTWTVKELIDATYAMLAKNNLQDAYIRPLVFAPNNMSFKENDTSFIMIAAWPMGLFLGNGLIRVMTSSFQRPNPKAFIMEAKATGHYVNSIMASQEAKRAGFDEALLLDVDGYIAEAPGANVFVEKDGVLFTPPLGNILPGITRATVIELCGELEMDVVEKRLTPEELSVADSAFFCGTAAEVIGIASVDDIVFPKAWSETKGALIQGAYKNLVIEKEYAPALHEA